MSVTPTDISIALADLHQDDYANVLGFIRTIKGNAPKLPPEVIAYNQQTDLVYELNQLHALVDTCRLALDNMGQSETESCNRVLMQVSNRLHDLYEQQDVKAKQLESIAYPEDAEEGSGHE